MATQYYGPIAPLVQDAINQATTKVENTFKENSLLIDRLTNPTKYMTPGEIGFALTNSAVYDVFKGMTQSVTGLVFGTGLALWDLLVDIRNTVNAPTKEAMLKEGVSAIYRLSNNVLTALGTTGAGLLSVGAEVLTLGYADTTWAQDYAKNLQVLNRQYAYYQSRGQDNVGRFMSEAMVATGNPLYDAALLNKDDPLLKDAFNQQALYAEDYEKKFGESFKNIVNQSANIKKFIDKEIFDTIVKTAGLKQQKDIADMLYADSPLYQAFSGVLQSIGAILMAQGLAKFSNAQGLTNPEQSAALATAYFGTQVFGNSFEQAIDNGASISDAYMFATANAVIETMIEQIGGLKLGLDKNILPTTFQAFLRNGFEEGIEEVMSEFLTPGFDLYSVPLKDQKDFKLDRMTDKDIIQRMFFAFASGAVSGGVFGATNQFIYNQSLEGKFGMVQAAFKQDVQKVGKERAVLYLRQRLRELIKSLNNPNLQGYKVNKGQGYSLSTLTTAEKIQYIKNLGFGRIIDIDVNDLSRGALGTKDQPLTPEQFEDVLNNGYFSFKLRKDFVIDETVFQPIYNNQRISVQEWAVNAASGGETLNNSRVGPGKPFIPLMRANLTPVGKSILAMADKSGVPIVVVASDALQPELKNEVAFYINGVIFFNQSAEVDANTALAEVRKHELIHLIARRLPQQYKEIEEEVRSLIDFNQLIQVDPKNGTISLNYNAEFIKGLFTPEQQKQFFDNLDTALADILDTFGGSEKIFALMRLAQNPETDADTKKRAANRVRIITESIAVRMGEETTSYFVEAMVKDSAAFVRAIETQNPNIRERLKNFVSRMAQITRERRFQKQMERIFGANAPSAATLSTGEVKPVGKAAEVIESVEQKITAATRKLVKERSSLDYFYRNFFASRESLRQFINPTILKKYNEDMDLIFESLSRAIEIDPYSKVMSIEGTQYNIEDVFAGNMDFASKKTDKQKTSLQIFSENWNPNEELNFMEFNGLIDALSVDFGNFSNKDIQQIQQVTKKKSVYFYFILEMYKTILEEETEALSAGLGNATGKEAEEMRKKLKLLKTRAGIVSLLSNEIYPSRPVTNTLDFDSKYINDNMSLKAFEDMGAIFGDVSYNGLSFLDGIRNNKLAASAGEIMLIAAEISKSATLTDYFKKNDELILDKETKRRILIIAEFSIMNYAKNLMKKNIVSVPSERGTQKARIISKLKREARQETSVVQKTLSHAAYNATQKLANWIANNQIKVPPFLQGANFINSSFSTFDINNPGGIYVEIDLSEDLKQLKTKKEKQEYLDIIKQSYDLMLHTFLEGTHIASNNKKIKFGLDNYEYEVELLEKDVLTKKSMKSEDVGLTVYIYPTVKNIQEYIKKIEENEKELNQTKETKPDVIAEAKNNFQNIILTNEVLDGDNQLTSAAVLNNAQSNISNKVINQLSNIIPSMVQPLSGKEVVASVNLPWGKSVKVSNTMFEAKALIEEGLRNDIKRRNIDVEIGKDVEIRYFLVSTLLPTGSFYDTYFKDSNHFGTGYYFTHLEERNMQEFDAKMKTDSGSLSSSKKFLIGFFVGKRFISSSKNQNLPDLKHIDKLLNGEDSFVKASYRLAKKEIKDNIYNQFDGIFSLEMNLIDADNFYKNVIKPFNQFKVIGTTLTAPEKALTSSFDEEIRGLIGEIQVKQRSPLSSEQDTEIKNEYIPDSVFASEMSYHLFNLFFKGMKNPYDTPITNILKEKPYHIVALERIAKITSKKSTANTYPFETFFETIVNDVKKDLLAEEREFEEEFPFIPTYFKSLTLKEFTAGFFKSPESFKESKYHNKLIGLDNSYVEINPKIWKTIDDKITLDIKNIFGLSQEFFVLFLQQDFRDENNQYDLVAKIFKKVENNEGNIRKIIIDNIKSIIENLKKEQKEVVFFNRPRGYVVRAEKSAEVPDERQTKRYNLVKTAYEDVEDSALVVFEKLLKDFEYVEKIDADSSFWLQNESLYDSILNLKYSVSLYTNYKTTRKLIEVFNKDFTDFKKIHHRTAREIFELRERFYETQTKVVVLGHPAYNKSGILYHASKFLDFTSIFLNKDVNTGQGYNTYYTYLMGYLDFENNDFLTMFAEFAKARLVNDTVLNNNDMFKNGAIANRVMLDMKNEFRGYKEDLQNGKISYKYMINPFQEFLKIYDFIGVDLREISKVIPEIAEKGSTVLYLSQNTAEILSKDNYSELKDEDGVKKSFTIGATKEEIPLLTVQVGNQEGSYLSSDSVEKLLQEPFKIYTLNTTINFESIGLGIKNTINSYTDNLPNEAEKILVQTKAPQLNYPVIKISPSKMETFSQDSTGVYLNTDVARKLINAHPLLKDSEGRILRLYHGTKTLFKDFSYAFLQKVGLAYGPGFYFASDIETSSDYARFDVTTPKSEDKSNTALKQEGVLKEVYLNIKKPIYFEDDRSVDRIAKMGNTVFSRNEFASIFKELVAKELDTNGNLPELVKKVMFEFYFEDPLTYGIFDIKKLKTPEEFAAFLLNNSGGFTQYDSFSNQEELAVPGVMLSTLVRRWRTYLITKYLLQNRVITENELDEILKNNKEETVQGHFRKSVGFTHESILDDKIQKYLQKQDIENFYYNIWGNSFKDVLTATTDATGYDGIVNRAEREGHIIVAFNPKQIIDVNDAVSIRETSEFDPSTVVQEFNPNSITVIQPYFDAPYIQSSFKKAFNLSPVVYAIVPALWINSRENQRLVDPDKKLIYVERLTTPLPMDTSDNFGKFAGARAINAAIMIWADKTHPVFKDYQDLRESLETKKRYETNDFVYRFMKNRNTEEDAKVKKTFTDSDGKTSISFAVPYLGVGASYNTKINDFDQIPLTGKYIVIKASSPQVLERLNKIDFGKLAENGAVLKGKGFRASELIEEYNRIKENSEDLFDTLDKGETVYKRVSKKKTTARKINAQEESDIRSVFGDKIIREMLTVDENGNFQVKANSIPTRVKAEAKIKLDGAEFSEKTHAINIPFENLPEVVTGYKYEVLTVQELSSTPYLKLFYDIMKQTNITFVFTRNWKGKKNVRGISFHQKVAFIIIDNIKKGLEGKPLEFQKRLATILIHENLHELEMEENLHHELGQELALLMFSVNSSTNTMEISPFGKNFFDEIFAQGEPQLPNSWESTGFMEFLRYMEGYKYARKYLNADDISRILRTPKTVLKTEKDGDSKARLKGELVAQIGGYLMADMETMTKVYGLKLTDAQTLTLFQTISKMQANPNNTATGKAFLMITFEKYKELFDNYIKGLQAQFPSQKRFSVKTINEFIAKFTDNEFTTKVDLIRTYVKEREAGHRRKATIALDKIIYVASLLSKTVQEATEGFIALRKEFVDLQENSMYLLNLENSDVVKLSDNTIEKLIKQIRSRFKQLRDGTELETIILNRKDLTKQDPNKDFELEEWFLEAKEILEGIKEKYDVIPDEVIKIFGIKEKLEVFQSLTQLSATLQAMETLFNNDGKWDKQNVTFAEHLVAELEKIEDVLTPYFTAVNYVRTGALNPIVTPMAVFGAQVQVRTRLENKEIELLKLYFKQKINSAVNKLMEARLQKDSPASPFILKMTKIIEDMSVSINKTNVTVQEIAKELSAKVFIFVDEANAAIRKNFVGIERQEAYERLSQVTTLLSRGIGGMLMELSLMARDTTILDNAVSKGYLTQEQMDQMIEFYKKRKLTFSASAFASGVARIINAFATRYESIFGMGENVTNDEYVVNMHKQITNLGENKVRPVVEKLWQILTPQDFLGRLSDLFEGKVDLFPAILKLYEEATERSEKISADFHKKYIEFIKNNPGIQKYSIEETLDVSTDYLIGLPTDTFQKLVEEVKVEMKAEKERIQAMGEDDTLKEEYKVLKEEKVKLQEEKKKYQRGSANWLKINQDIRVLTAQMSAKRTELNNQKDQIKLAKESFKNNDSDSRLKVKIAEFLVDNPNITLNQNLPKGTIAALYLMVAREVEMLEIFEKARETDTDTLIKPTNHFRFSNQINILDNRILREVGYKEAISKTQPFTIYETSKVALRDYLKGLLSDPRDQIILDFAKMMFDDNYELFNEIFLAKFKTTLPRQSIYIPFATLFSDYGRELELAFASRYNAGVPDGVVTETTIGANTYLKAENIFTIIENHTRQAAKYSYERLLTDFQNILVNKAATIFTLQDRITNSSSFLGAPNNFLDYFQAMMVAVIGYSPIGDSKIEKIASDLLRLGRGARMAFSPSVAIKQLGSLNTISIKAPGWKKEYQFNALELYKNFLTVKLWRNKFYAKLKEINPNFYLRVVFGSIPDLAKAIDVSFIIQAQNTIEKLVELGVSVAGRMDSDIILSAFKTYFDKIQKANPNITEEEVFQLANIGVKKVLLYGVANTSRAYRSPFANSQTFAGKFASRFQSENNLQWSAILRYYWELLNNVPGADKKLLQSIISLLMSAFFSGMVTFALGSARNVYDEEDKFFELFVNEIIWGNLVGSVPLLNILTSSIEFDPKTFLRVGYEPELPGIGELVKVAEIISSGLTMQDGSLNMRKVLRIFEQALQPFGVPLASISRLVQTIFGFGAKLGNPTSMEAVQWFAGQTDAVALTQAIKAGDRNRINYYISQVYSSVPVQKEIMRILNSDSNIRLSLKSANFFTAEKDGVTSTYDIPQATRSFYTTLTMQALSRLIIRGGYTRMNDTQKTAIVQRVINYYWNHMRNYVINEDGKAKIASSSGLSDVIQRAIDYEKR
jgi:hypothetical protein